MTVNNCQSRGVTEPQREVDFAEQKTEGECESLLFLSVAASNVKLHAGSFHRKRSPSLPDGGQRITKQLISRGREIPTRCVALVSSLLDRVRYAQDDGDEGSF